MNAFESESVRGLARNASSPVSYTHLDGLAYRHDYHEQPPRVEYGLTELGTKMLPIVNSLADFGNYYKSMIEQN